MNYTVSNMERLGAAFENVYVIMGNHDLYYRDRERSIQWNTSGTFQTYTLSMNG